MKEDTHVLVGSKFSALPRKSARIYLVHGHKLNTYFCQDEFLDMCNLYISDYTSIYTSQNSNLSEYTF